MARLGYAVAGALALAGAGLASITTVRFEPADPPAAPEPRSGVERAAKLPPAPVDLGRISVPVAGVSRSALLDTWGQSRSGGSRAHQAIDIPAPAGTPVVAAASGVVEKLFNSDAGGITLYVRSPDRRTSYYYAHLQRYAPGVREGMRVEQGQPIGFVGDTGNSGAGNHHLHFGVSRMGDGDSWYGGEPLNPYPLLAEREGGR
jgi:murein DD-endopeptidase MepM/ murein hydrolase activator NlpD